MVNENPFGLVPKTLLSTNVTVWCGFTTSFIVRPFFFEQIGTAVPVTRTVNGGRYETILRNHVIPAFQECACVGRIFFTQDGTPPHIEN